MEKIASNTVSSETHKQTKDWLLVQTLLSLGAELCFEASAASVVSVS